MIPVNILSRTFQFSFVKNGGTCFTIDHDNRQYIVTARHIVKAITDSAIIRIKHANKWISYPVNLVGHSEGQVDISVLAAAVQISTEPPLPMTAGDITFGQDVYFLGFPYGLATEVGKLNRNFPIPLVKKGILSAIDRKNRLYLLDGHNNPGFSGGPVILSEAGKQANQLSVAGVISGYQSSMEPVYLEDKPTPLQVTYNTGIILTYAIQHVIDLIRQNPIGFNLRDRNIS